MVLFITQNTYPITVVIVGMPKRRAVHVSSGGWCGCGGGGSESLS